MSLRSACVDRAQVVETVGVGAQVEGQTLAQTIEGPWFPCRLTIGPSIAEFSGGVEEATAMRGNRSSASSRRSTMLMWPDKDVNGNPVVIHFTEKVRVVSKEQGEDFIWQLEGEPQPIRKKRRVIGYEARLTRVREWERRDVTPAAQGLS